MILIPSDLRVGVDEVYIRCDRLVLEIRHTFINKARNTVDSRWLDIGAGPH